jgi:hypothetical protein
MEKFLSRNLECWQRKCSLKNFKKNIFERDENIFFFLYYRNDVFKKQKKTKINKTKIYYFFCFFTSFASLSFFWKKQEKKRKKTVANSKIICSTIQQQHLIQCISFLNCFIKLSKYFACIICSWFLLFCFYIFLCFQKKENL